VLLAAAVLVVVFVVIDPFTTSAPASPAVGLRGIGAGQIRVVAPVIAAQPVSAEQLAALPQATTFATVSDAPADPAASAVPSGRVVHPAATVPVFTAPGGAAIAAVPPQQLDSDTWLPIVAEQPGWVQVLLPSRPNGSTAWLPLNDPSLTVARSPYLLRVDRAAFTLTLTRDGQETGRWPVGVGKPESVTPAGRTFVMASIKDTHPTFSPIVLPLGAHSDTYTTYGGGPGTVAIHTWPAAAVYGTASSDGCVRVPPEALQVISAQVPLGTPVLVS
jgi:lipoprotein-anchoring transpeptidase ErfK/SrfK